MKLFLANQERKLRDYLAEFKSKSVMSFYQGSLPEKVSQIQINTTKKFNDLDFEVLFNYRIFPKNILAHATQWSFEQREMQPGDTIVQQIFVPSIAHPSIKLVCGVRIKEVIDKENIKGFSYETLEGHVERGISIFTVETLSNGIIFKIQTFSEPANYLIKLFGSFLTVPYQAFCTAKALEFTKKGLEQ